MTTPPKGTHYVYVYLDPRKPGAYTYPGVDRIFTHEPFYVGKGTGTRYKQHLRIFLGDNPHKENKIRKMLAAGHKIPVVMIFTSNCAEAAYREEARVISIIGRTCTGGVLTNYHAGGEGGTSPPAEIRKKISESLLGRVIPAEQLAKMRQYWKGRDGTLKGRVGSLHPCYGRTGALSAQYGKRGELSATYGRKRPADELVRMRYNKITFISQVLDTFTGQTYRIFNISAFAERNGLPRGTSLLDTYTGRKTTLYRGLQVIEKVTLPARWFDNPETLADYFVSLEIQIEGLATRNTRKAHGQHVKLSAIKFHYTVRQGKILHSVYDMAGFCRFNNLDKATLHRTFTGKATHHKGFTITGKEPLPKDWRNIPVFWEDFQQTTLQYQLPS